MKKAKLFLIPVLALGLLSGCGESGGEESKPLFTYKDGLIDFGETFKNEYYPNLDKIDTELAGEITVALAFEGKADGWREVAKEYERLHEGSVHININDNYSAENYPDKVKTELEGGDPSWNIVQGNLIDGSIDKSQKLETISNSERNPYAGNKRMYEFTSSDAFDKENRYIVNSENLQTAWFVNKVAMNKATQNGYTYKDASGNPAYPETWDQLIELCAAMNTAGYRYPLGLSLDKESIMASQFSWLLRVYGDYYYRDEYSKISNSSTFVMDLQDPNIESKFSYKQGRLFSTILDTNSTVGGGEKGSGYVGAGSNKFKEFVNQFKKISSYINPNAITQKFSDVRNRFGTQTSANTNDMPQIMIDYLGEGFGTINATNSAFEVGYFDNPKMVSETYINDNRLLRDVGGNGGYLSITSQKSAAKTEISQDFLKFFLSPYGQSIYYAKLATTNLHPQGMTTVKESVVIPAAWKNFFDSASETITFSGQVDKDPYISFLIRFMSTSGEQTNKNAASYWESLLTKGGSVETFAKNWGDDIMTDWLSYAEQQGLKANCYLNPDADERA